MLTSCRTPQSQPTPDTVPTDIPQANMPNPASSLLHRAGIQVRDSHRRRRQSGWLLRLPRRK
ncbi:MAG: hypothetical protein MZU84_06740 [Sphingobacterium sp.]|nr:hypothetical protein [Sphingobacterium sp.]